MLHLSILGVGVALRLGSGRFRILVKENSGLELTILGCGTSTGVPLINCKCRVCRSHNPRNKRLRTSAWIRWKGKSLLIDASTDFRQQALKHRIKHLDAVLFTHPHADHVNGIDELRCYNFTQKSRIPVYGNGWTTAELGEKFKYIFTPGAQEGGGIPLLDLHAIGQDARQVEIAGLRVEPVRLMHGSKESLGYKFDGVAYLTDCSYIPDQSLEKVKGIDVLVIDCLREKPHGTHFNLDQALEVIARLRPRKAYLTHLSHDVDYAALARKLPRGVYPAFDGLRIKV